MRSWLPYTLARLGVLVAVFAILMLLGVQWWLSAIFATVIALCVSILAFGPLRARMTAGLAARSEHRGRKTLADVDAEDEDAEAYGGGDSASR